MLVCDCSAFLSCLACHKQVEQLSLTVSSSKCSLRSDSEPWTLLPATVRFFQNFHIIGCKSLGFVLGLSRPCFSFYE